MRFLVSGLCLVPSVSHGEDIGDVPTHSARNTIQVHHVQGHVEADQVGLQRNVSPSFKNKFAL